MTRRAAAVALALMLVAGCSSDPVSDSSTSAPTTLTAPITSEPMPVAIDPPAPDLVTVDGVIDLGGSYWDCLFLEYWENGGWLRVGSSRYDNAVAGVWGAPTDDQACDPVLRSGDPIRLPEDAVPGMYRVMGTVVWYDPGVGS